jgi:hypothetical protein
MEIFVATVVVTLFIIEYLTLCKQFLGFREIKLSFFLHKLYFAHPLLGLILPKNSRDFPSQEPHLECPFPAVFSLSFLSSPQRLRQPLDLPRT